MGVYPRGCYNIEEGLSKWFTEFEDLNTNHDKILDLVFIGDSICAGTGAGTTLDEYKNRSFVGWVRKKLHKLFEDTRQGFVPPYWHDPSTVQQMTIGAGWNRFMNRGMLESYSTTTNGSMITIPFIGTGIRLYYYHGSTQYTPGTFTTQIDGGEVVNHDAAGTEDPTHYIDLTGLENGTHTLILTYTGTAQQRMIFEGACELNDATYGVRTHCIGHAGASFYLYFDQYQAFVDACVDGIPSPLYVICCGVNDYGTGDAARLTAFKSGLRKLVTKIKDNDADCLILIEGTPTFFNSTWDSYRAEYYGIADELNCAIIDFGERWDGREELVIIDTIHPNQKGHKSMADTIFQVLKTLPSVSRVSVEREPVVGRESVTR